MNSALAYFWSRSSRAF